MIRTILNFCQRHRTACRIYGFASLSLACIVLLAGCAVPSFLTDIEAVVLVGGNAVTGILALLGQAPGATLAKTAVTDASAVFSDLNTLITEYKTTPNETTLQKIEAGFQLASEHLAKILQDVNIPPMLAGPIQAAIQVVLLAIQSALSVIPVFKDSTAGQTIGPVTKPVPAAVLKAAVHEALTAVPSTT